MITIFEKVDSKNINNEIIKKAAGILQGGGLVAFPTETVYGLGANGLNADACRKIYEAKGRPSDNPLILHIGDISQLDMIVKEIPKKAEAIINKYWPGPITIIFRKNDIVPDSVSGNMGTVAVRFPSNPVAKMLIKEAGIPVAAPSANTSGKPSPTKAQHVYDDMNGKIEMIIDGGMCDVGLESTIVDATGENIVILRPGAITKEMLEETVGTVDIDKAVFKQLKEGETPKAPGMKYKHYSPDAEVVLIKGRNTVKAINEFIKEDRKNGFKTGVMCLKENVSLYNADFVLDMGESAKEAASKLFYNLREFDVLGADKVYSEVFEEKEEGLAVMNRLKKAAGHRIIDTDGQY